MPDEQKVMWMVMALRKWDDAFEVEDSFIFPFKIQMAPDEKMGGCIGFMAVFDSYDAALASCKGKPRQIVPVTFAAAPGG